MGEEVQAQRPSWEVTSESGDLFLHFHDHDCWTFLYRQDYLCVLRVGEWFGHGVQRGCNTDGQRHGRTLILGITVHTSIFEDSYTRRSPYVWLRMFFFPSSV